MIRFFVSSTFADMQKERDCIQQSIWPTIEKVANEHYETIQFEDFRWGIDTSGLTEEEHDSKILHVCLDEVSNCHPYMIIMIGDRYGSLIKKELLDNYSAELSRFLEYPFSENRVVGLTELEILFGTKFFKSISKCIFCFKDRALEILDNADDTLNYDSIRLKRLILKIKSVTPKYLFKYSDMESFEILLSEKINEILNEEYCLPKYQSRVNKTLRDFEFQAKKTSKRNYGISDKEDQLKHFIYNGERNIIIVGGESGAGKSFFLNRLYTDLLHNDSFSTMIHLCGEKNFLKSSKDILISSIAFLEELLGKESSVDYECNEYLLDLKEKFCFLLREHQKLMGKILLIFVDSYECLNLELVNTTFNWLPKNMENYVRVVMTCDNYHLPSYRKYHKVDISDKLSQKDIDIRIAGFEKQYHKDISQNVKNTIIRKCENNNSLLLASILMRLQIMNENDFDSIGKLEVARDLYISNLLMKLPDSASICLDIIEKANELVEIKGMFHTLVYISLSKSGLRESDLIALLTKHNIIWSIFECKYILNSLSELFTEHADGRIDFLHAFFRKGIEEKTSENNFDHTNSFRQYLLTLPVNDEIFRENYISIAEKTENFKGAGRYMLFLANEYKIINENKTICADEMNGKEDLVFAVRALWSYSCGKHHPNGIHEILDEIEFESEQNKVILCRYFSDLLDQLSKKWTEYVGFKRCLTNLREYCSKFENSSMKVYTLACDVSLAYLVVMDHEYEKGGDELNNISKKIKEIYKVNPSAEIFNLYFICEVQRGNAYFKNAMKKEHKNNQQSMQKAYKYYKDSWKVYKEIYYEAMEYYKEFENTNILVKLSTLLQWWLGADRKLEQYTQLLRSKEDFCNITKDYLEKAEKIIDAKAAWTLMPFLNTIIIYADECNKYSNSREGLIYLKNNEKFIIKLADLQEESDVYKLLYRYYQTYFRLAVMKIQNEKQEIWNDAEYALEKMIYFIEEYPDMFERAIWEREINSIKNFLYFVGTTHVANKFNHIKEWLVKFNEVISK